MGGGGGGGGGGVPPSHADACNANKIMIFVDRRTPTASDRSIHRNQPAAELQCILRYDSTKTIYF